MIFVDESYFEAIDDATQDEMKRTDDNAGLINLIALRRVAEVEYEEMWGRPAPNPG